ncbi:unnamed protein product [Effrenium voratum]|nr:unnamed protein product [Effrenium voratum]
MAGRSAPAPLGAFLESKGDRAGQKASGVAAATAKTQRQQTALWSSGWRPSDEESEYRAVLESTSSVRFHEIHETIEDPIFPEVQLEREVSPEGRNEDSDEEDTLPHGDSSYLLSDLEDLSQVEQRSIKHRLRLRLGHVTKNKLVSGKSLHGAMVSLGLTRYEEHEMNDFVNHLAAFVNLEFDTSDKSNSWSAGSLFSLKFAGDVRDLEPSWTWPQLASPGHLHREYSKASFKAPEAPLNFDVVPVQAIMEVFLAREGKIHKRIFGPKLLKQFKAMKEVLLAGDTNRRLVAELTFVRLNDLAAPPEPIHILMYLEPFIALLIVANGIVIGFQTDPNFDSWDGWIYIDVTFAGFLVLEILIRFAVLGCCEFWRGSERCVWNFFDSFLAVAAITDISWQLSAAEPPDMAGTFLLRFFRLVRLARIVRVFRLKVMKDLRLMVRGLVAGIWTLSLAFTLLFAVLYVIAGFANIAMGGSSKLLELGLTNYFYNIPVSMFTAFRCFTGDCTNGVGHSITTMLTAEFGLPFVLGYIASYMLVTMGIFNVILAVYVDITMKAAKENDAVTADQYARESIRVARATRELLKKFAAAYHLCHVDEQMHENVNERLEINHAATLFTDDEIHDNIEISKELFLLVVQDRGVQRLMDELELPAGRAHLFEVIDADGSGSLQISELLQGLLKLRGEVNKGDAIAPLLATRVIQQKLEKIQEESNRILQRLPSADLLEHLELMSASLAYCTQSLQSASTLNHTPSASLPTYPGPRGPLHKVPCRPSACEEE